MTEIAPAILTNDVSDFRKKYAELFALQQYFTKLHVDFADGNFVDNKTVMPEALGFLKDSKLTLVAHLMTYHPRTYMAELKKAGFKSVLFHYEACKYDAEIGLTLHLAEKFGLKAGIVLNPETQLYKIKDFMLQLPLIQLMGIKPGAQGRTFIPQTLTKIMELRNMNRSVIICVDGGVKVGIAKQCAMAGADILVAGFAILKAQDEHHAVEALVEDIKI